MREDVVSFYFVNFRNIYYLPCNNVVIISEGKVLAKGSVEDIKKQTKAKNLEQAYINLTKNLSKTGVDNA